MSLVVEGLSDASVVSRIVRDHGLVISRVLGLQGKDYLDRKLPAFNAAAKFGKWIVVRDLDRDAGCAAGLVGSLLPVPNQGMRLRIAVRAIEAWLLADVDGVMSFFGVERQHVPNDPEALADPKRALIDVARRSRARAIREDMVPEVGTTARVGPGFVTRIADFADSHWSWARGSRRSDSLRRCVERVAALR